MAEVNEDNKQVEEAKQDTPVAEEKSAEEVLYPDKEVESKEEPKQEDPKQEEVKEDKEDSPAESDELKLVTPEGSMLSDEDVTAVKEFAKANKLSQESAQKILDEKSGVLTKAIAKQNADFKEKVEGWLKEVKQSKTFDEDLKHTQKVLDDWFDPDFKKLLNESGLGNHPSLFKGLAKLGKAMNPQKFVSAPRTAAAPKMEDYELFYGPDEKSG